MWHSEFVLDILLTLCCNPSEKQLVKFKKLDCKSEINKTDSFVGHFSLTVTSALQVES